MEYEPIFDKLLKLDIRSVRTDTETLFIFVGNRLYMVYWSYMNEEYSIVCQDTSEWLSDDRCYYDTFYAQTEDEVIESINADLEEHKCKPLEFKKEKLKKIVPFDYELEEDRAFLRGKWIRGKNSPDGLDEMQIIAIQRPFVITNDVTVGCEALLKNFVFLDGSPCGKEVIE